jgi:hypothetical protein
MNAKELALELAALQAPLRAQLLAELPENKCIELQQLIEELQPLLEAPGGFAALMAELEDERPAPPLADEAILGRLLGGETMPVRKQLIDVFAGGHDHLLTGHVRQLVADYLQAQADHLPAPPPPAARKVGWRRFWK